MSSDARTSLDEKWATPPSNSDQQPADDSSQPGATFDRLSDPFEDDSASYKSAEKAAIQQATYANEVPASSPKRGQAAPDHDSDYAEYFRK